MAYILFFGQSIMAASINVINKSNRPIAHGQLIFKNMKSKHKLTKKFYKLKNSESIKINIHGPYMLTGMKWDQWDTADTSLNTPINPMGTIEIRPEGQYTLNLSTFNKHDGSSSHQVSVQHHSNGQNYSSSLCNGKPCSPNEIKEVNRKVDAIQKKYEAYLN